MAAAGAGPLGLSDLRTPREAVQRIRALVEARGGAFPTDLEAIAESILAECISYHVARPAEARILALFEHHDGVITGSHETIAREIGVNRETVTRVFRRLGVTGDPPGTGLAPGGARRSWRMPFRESRRP